MSAGYSVLMRRVIEMDQVVCIDDDWLFEIPNPPIKDQIYTIVDVLGPTYCYNCQVDHTYYQLAERKNYAFEAGHFRPVRKTDIGIFKDKEVPVDRDLVKV